MVDESIALLEEMYTRICEENGQILCSGVVSNLAGLLADSGGDLDRAGRWASVLLITYAHTYETVILEVLDRRLSSSEWYYGCYNQED
jgi:hypothetical protein